MTEGLSGSTMFQEELYQIPPRPVVVVTIPWNDLKSEEKEQLVKITEALRQRINPKLGLDTFRIVFSPVLDLSAWPEKPEKLIYFGPPVKGLNHYEVIKAGKTSMVLAHDLSDLIADEASRSKLWNSLKQLFGS